jgi:hypothetical protein
MGALGKKKKILVETSKTLEKPNWDLVGFVSVFLRKGHCAVTFSQEFLDFFFFLNHNLQQ